LFETLHEGKQVEKQKKHENKIGLEQTLEGE
jgi:hypothetical protein